MSATAKGQSVDALLSTKDRVNVGSLVCQGYGVEDISLMADQPKWVVRALIQSYRQRGLLRGMLANGWKTETKARNTI